jgi:hypothetical protein
VVTAVDTAEAPPRAADVRKLRRAGPLDKGFEHWRPAFLSTLRAPRLHFPERGRNDSVQNPKATRDPRRLYDAIQEEDKMAAQIGAMNSRGDVVPSIRQHALGCITRVQT